jgi:hypothetical protein
MSAPCERCGRAAGPEEVRQYGGCGCTLMHGSLVAPSPYSDDFVTYCPTCSISMIYGLDENGYSWFVCGCGLRSLAEQERADEQLMKRLEQAGDTCL